MFATYPLLAGIEKANMIFNIVFFISVTSVLIQGTTLTVVAKWLNVALPEKIKPASESENFILDIPKSTLQEIKILPDFYAVNKRIVDLNFPKSAFIVLIKRNGEYIRPGGSTEIKAKDTLMVLGDHQEDFAKVNDSLDKQFHPQKS
ncbi:K(+)/H(+) antiporter NhaP2 [compost metagenome]